MDDEHAADPGFGEAAETVAPADVALDDVDEVDSDEVAVEIEVGVVESEVAPDGTLRRATLVALGSAEIVGSAALIASDALARRVSGELRATTNRAERADRPSRLLLVPTALLGAGIEMQRRAFAVAADLRDSVSAIGEAVPHVRPPTTVDLELLRLHRRGLEELDHAREVVVARVNTLIGEIIQVVMSQIDLNKIIAEIDVEEIIASIDIPEVLSRVDVATIVEELDIASIVRDSTGVLSGEAVTTLRVQGIKADDTVSRIVDRILRRHRPAPTAPTSGGELAL